MCRAPDGYLAVAETATHAVANFGGHGQRLCSLHLCGRGLTTARGAEQAATEY